MSPFLHRGRSAFIVIGIAAIVALLPLAACANGGGGGDEDGSDAGALKGSVWVLTSYFDGSSTQVVPKGMRVDATFADDQVSGRAPVNSYSGPATPSGDSGIKIGPLASTMIAGPEKQMALEQAYFAALERVGTYSIDGTTLKLADAEGTTLLTFAADAAPDISGRTWQVTGYNNGKEAVVSVVAGSELTAEFDGTGRVSGSSGVNTYRGPYTVDGDAITIGDLSTTKMAGPAALMEQETAYLAALRSAATWSIRGDTLELRTADDAIAVTFTAAAVSSPSP